MSRTLESLINEVTDFSQLGSNWDGNACEAINDKSVELCNEFLYRYYQDLIHYNINPEPSIEGKVLLEFYGDRDFAIFFGPDEFEIVEYDIGVKSFSIQGIEDPLSKVAEIII